MVSHSNGYFHMLFDSHEIKGRQIMFYCTFRLLVGYLPLPADPEESLSWRGSASAAELSLSSPMLGRCFDGARCIFCMCDGLMRSADLGNTRLSFFCSRLVMLRVRTTGVRWCVCVWMMKSFSYWITSLIGSHGRMLLTGKHDNIHLTQIRIVSANTKIIIKSAHI